MVRFKKSNFSFLSHVNWGLVFSFLLFCSPAAKAQLTTSTALTPAQLVQTVLLGSGITASNITYNGAPLAIGSFNGSASNIGLAAGVLMTSGDLLSAIGPNNSSSAYVNNSLAGDPDLDQIMSPTLSYDASILEFDFTPTSDTIKFRYVFGSEEYMEYVSTTPGGINDGFGFFISGPGITGPFSGNSKNIALIPGTTLPVTMFNLNLNSYGMYYFDNGDGMGSGTAPDGLTVQYDGFTVPLTAITGVQCGQVYHIKIAIADGGDHILDSGVFLEAGSFASAGSTNLTSGTTFGGNVVAGNDSTIYEGCGFASLLVTRTSSTAAQTFPYSLGGTATNGTDYTLIGSTVNFAPGQDSAYIIINSLADATIEGTETVVLSLFATSTCGGNDTLKKTIYIIDTPPLKVQLNDDTSLVCPSSNLFLTAQTAGGVAIGSYRYTWTNSAGTHDTIHINPLVTTTYIVTVTDSCGNTASDTSTVNFTPYIPMQLVFNDDTTICGSNSLMLHAIVANGLPPYIYHWTPNISNQDTVTIAPNITSSYSVKITDGCAYSKSDTVKVTVYPIFADFQTAFVTNQTVAFNNLSLGAVSYFWSFGDLSNDSTSTLQSPEHYYPTEGTYRVMLVATNQNGCKDTAYKTVTILPDFYFYTPNAFTPNKNGKNDLFTGYGAGIKSYRMRIFNRWGQLLFESTDINNGWDGTYKGQDSVNDVYVCVFDLESMRGKQIRRIESVTLVR